ncbi:MAG: SDR family oxidoreductase [Bacteroidaceae bacterium]|nr:SDR family oxidoreductase [Bacteroidaceae bacterium]
MTKIKGNNVLITGGASGIGRLMGRMSLEKGARTLIIWDINEANIASTVEEFKSIGNVKGYRVDVSDSDKVVETAALTQKECGNVDIVINCAGIVTSNATFDKLGIKEIERTMEINATAPMIIAQQFLPGMIERNHGHICNIASAAGMIANPRMSVYVASKWAVIGWSDSVRIELKQMRSKVRFTTIAPYFINTGMFDGVKSRLFPILKPEPTAKKIIKSIEKNRNFKGIPFGYHFIRFCQALLPTSIFDYIFGEVVGIFHAMDHFTGRQKKTK